MEGKTPVQVMQIIRRDYVNDPHKLADRSLVPDYKYVNQ